MEIIDISGYITEEKIEIAQKHLIPKQLSDHGLKEDGLKFNKQVLGYLIDSHTRESGVRQLDKQIAKITRISAKKIALEEKFNTTLSLKDVKVILGSPRFIKDKYENNDFAGVVTGLAWTAVGGEILFVEASPSKGSGKLTLTGNLGDVMKESAILALEYLKAHSDLLDINPEIFEKWNVHVHVPEGAIPKDGPSAGVTMVTSLASAFTQRKVKMNIAMTGEITLRGKILPVGGIKEKMLAAKRAGIKDILLSRENEKDVEEIKEIYREGLKFHYVDNISQVLEFALMKEKVKKPLKIEV